MLRRGWELGVLSVICATHCVFLFVCVCVIGLIASAHGPTHPQTTHKGSLVPARGHCELGVSHL